MLVYSYQKYFMLLIEDIFQFHLSTFLGFQNKIGIHIPIRIFQSPNVYQGTFQFYQLKENNRKIHIENNSFKM